MTHDLLEDTVNIVQPVAFKVSCTNLGRSVAFYELLGYSKAGEASAIDGDWIGDLYGVHGAWPRVQMMTLGDDPRGVRLELLQWSRQGTRVEGPNAVGAGAIGLRTKDIRADLAILKEKGVVIVSEIVSRVSSAGELLVVTLRDPDGLSIQLIQFVKLDSAGA
jgi:catechol 2,3-dioxygenase-like lactoylglutathione lyase family enzyme